MNDDLARPEQSRPSSVVRLVGAVAVVGLLALLVLGVRWWTHPAIFGGLGDGYVSRPLPVADSSLSTTVIFPEVGGDPETVRIDSVRAVFSKNTAEASATFSICHMGVGEDPIGAVHDPETYCQDIEPFEAGASFRRGVAPDSDYLFVTIAPTTAGVAHLLQVEVRYARAASHLYQQGTEAIRVDRKVTAK